MGFKTKRAYILILSLVIATASILSVSASDLFSFQMNPQNPLYEPYLADPFNTDFALNYIMLSEAESRPAYLYKVQGSGESLAYQGYDIDQYYTKGTHMIQMRTGTVIPIARLTFNGSGFIPSLSVEGVFKGGFRSIFFAYSGTDLLGFDGTYSYGMHAKLGNSLTFAFGRKHHSGHIGDEIITKIEKQVAHSGSLFEDDLIDYVRQDPIYYGVSFDIISSLRLYGELRIGDTGNILKPEHTTDAAEEDGYRGRELQLGVELSLPLYKIGDLSIAFNTILHESGKFIPNGDGALKNGAYELYTFTYDPDASWEMEYQVVLAQTLTTRTEGMKARLTATYHWGRFPLLAFYMSKGSYLAVGAAFSF